MLYQININQIGILRSGLLGEVDLIDMAILAHIESWVGRKNSKERIINGETYVWANYKDLRLNIPITGLTTKNPFRLRLKHLKEIGLVDMIGTPAKMYVNLTEKYREMRFYNEEETQKKLNTPLLSVEQVIESTPVKRGRKSNPNLRRDLLSRKEGEVFIPVSKLKKPSDYIIDEDTIRKGKEIAEYFKQGRMLLDTCENINNYKLSKWAKYAEKLIQAGRSVEEIKAVIDYAIHSDYWSQITEMYGFVDKFKGIYAQYKNKKKATEGLTNKNNKFIVGHTHIDEDEYHKIPEKDLRQYWVGRKTGKWNGAEDWEEVYIRQSEKRNFGLKDITEEDIKKYGN